ncbi:hypothetical protein GCM10011375_32730 [Hymenobacter qilianensis]|uniref:Uncharacterized protein n=2 Tax=Hymenobacter qilianensis TaxID=1385715 RepID=A0ACB5PV39_9BACT|nr:hypothetical protein [Hymenobacter qilianensis]QNP51445.1 hypothetical protein H9L05_15655 [Hymenobacter qilianensis]GGF75091.1 hypothetical protein GCM10011375_32730 [Hymenobacter qilianensis]
MKKISKKSASLAERTEWDKHFLLIIDEVKSAFNIKSDRAMCRQLGIHENLISRVRTGIQSVPATVWDILNKQLRTPEYKAKGFGGRGVLQITSASRVQNEASVSDSPDTDEFKKDTGLQPITQPSLQTECAKDLEVANEIIALLTRQLADKQRTIQLLLEQNNQK